MAATKSQILKEAVVAVGRRCFYCGARAEHADHIICLKRGGEHVAENLVPACASCNCKKNDQVLSPELEKEARMYAFIQKPLVMDMADNLFRVHNLQKFHGLSFAGGQE
jgi:hypothetical protein